MLKMVQCRRRMGHLHFFCPQPGGFDSSRVPTPRNLPSKGTKCQCPGVSPVGGWAQLELTLIPNQTTVGVVKLEQIQHA